MLILVHLDATLFLFCTLAEFVMSPPTMPNTAYAKRMCQSSLEWQHTLVNPVDKLSFLSSMRACGLVPGSHILSLIKTNFNTMASQYKTTISTETSLFPLSTLNLPFHLISQAPSFFLTPIPLPNMNLIHALIYIAHLQQNGIHKPCILHWPDLWWQKQLYLTLAWWSQAMPFPNLMCLQFLSDGRIYMRYMIPTVSILSVWWSWMCLVRGCTFPKSSIQLLLQNNSASGGALDWINLNRLFKSQHFMVCGQLYCHWAGHGIGLIKCTTRGSSGDSVSILTHWLENTSQ